jgi:hypothetical protein
VKSIKVNCLLFAYFFVAMTSFRPSISLPAITHQVKPDDDVPGYFGSGHK